MDSDLLVTLRPPATEAHYHNPEAEKLFDATMRLIEDKANLKAITLPRNARQKQQIQDAWPQLILSGRVIIPDEPLNGLDLIWFSDLVISGGGTMNREAAALGVPVYSIFRGKIGAVDRFLADTGRRCYLKRPTTYLQRLSSSHGIGRRVLRTAIAKLCNELSRAFSVFWRGSAHSQFKRLDESKSIRAGYS